jgi:hypothetical protein
MSNALAIAATTETLVTLLSQYIDLANVNGAWVSNATPDQIDKVAQPGVNVFLYQVSPNAALRNADLPTRAPDGTLLQKPQLALDLHYLLTFYGDDTFLEQQRLLGAAALTLHRFPIFPASLIQPAPIKQGVSLSSGLETQSELIRFTPVSFSLEEMSKLWSFLLKVDYVLSAAYLASVVLIEADDVTSPPALPVLSYNVPVQPIRQPTITSVVAVPNANTPITMATAIALLGSNLAAPSGGATQVVISGITQHPNTGPASSVAAFVLNPMIASGSPPGSYAISVLSAFGSPPGPAIQVGIVPAAQSGQRVLVQMLPQAAPANGQLFDGGTLSANTDTLIIPIPGLASGNYLVRVLVDDAMSPLVTGPGGVPVAPLIGV